MQVMVCLSEKGKRLSPGELAMGSRDAVLTMSEYGELPDFIGTGDSLGLPDKLAFLAGYGDLFIAVIGDRGRGKSLIARRLVEDLDGFCPTALIQGKMAPFDQLLPYLGQCFDLQNDQQRRPVNIESLTEFVQELIQQGRRPVLIVDDAGKLKDRLLKQVFNIAEKCGLGLVMLGSPSLTRKHSFKAFSSRIYTCRLGQMTGDDLRSYIRRRHDIGMQVSEAQLNSILQNSNGMPKRIDQLVEDLLGAPQRRLGIPVMHMSVIVVMVVILFGAWIFEGEDRGDQVSQVETGFKAIRVGPSPLAGGRAEDQGTPDDTPQKSSIEPFSIEQIRMVTTPEVIQRNALETDRRSDSIDLNSLPSPAAGISQSRTTTPSPTGRKPVLGISTPSLSGQRSRTISSVSNQDSDNLTTPVRPTEPAAMVTRRDNPSLISEPEPQKNWILSARPTDYTLQLMGSHNEAGILEFISAQAETEEFAYFETLYRNETWYVLTVGQYPSREHALAAIYLLTPELQAQHPWARSIESIRAALY